ncbi:MAG: hypothetical protein J6A23_14215 [Thermoguttaceae bacterium]|nr:hypothetical protein [Thermoguttaceae bacterium]
MNFSDFGKKDEKRKVKSQKVPKVLKVSKVSKSSGLRGRRAGGLRRRSPWAAVCSTGSILRQVDADGVFADRLEKLGSILRQVDTERKNAVRRISESGEFGTGFLIFLLENLLFLKIFSFFVDKWRIWNKIKDRLADGLFVCIFGRITNGSSENEIETERLFPFESKTEVRKIFCT